MEWMVNAGQAHPVTRLPQGSSTARVAPPRPRGTAVIFNCHQCTSVTSGPQEPDYGCPRILALHAVPGSAAEFIRRLEKAYQVAYGKHSLNKDTRDALLYGQLYEGLRYELMRAPAVSGTQSYQELCVAAKGEEHRLAALRQRQQYKPQGEPSSRTPRTNSGQSGPCGPSQDSASAGTRKPATPDTTTGAQVICYNCGKPGHLAKNCRQHKQESK